MSDQPLPRGSTIGVLGNGQLGRMFTEAAQRLGYIVWVLGPGQKSPAGQVADREIDANYDDVNALDQLANGCDVVTFEFENIPRKALDHLTSKVTTLPSPEVLSITQNRLREKNWLKQNGFPLADFVWVRSREELEDAIIVIGTPAVLKTAAFGYDGKGQTRIDSDTNLDTAWAELGGGEAVLEAWVDFQKELSVVCARNIRGETRCFPVCENSHHRHILSVTRCPAVIDNDLSHKAQAYTMQVAQAMRVTGLITAEFFLTHDGELLFNELAPRPHNSGHATMQGCSSSQFTHHVLAVTNRPLPVVTSKAPALMVNLLGDLWENGEPDWESLRALPGATLYLYGKKEPQPRRKMGHLTVIGEENISALEMTLLRLGRDQVFDPPRPATAAELLEAKLQADPFTPFKLTLKDQRILAVDDAGAIAKLRGKYVFESKEGTLSNFSAEEVELVE